MRTVPRDVADREPPRPAALIRSPKMPGGFRVGQSPRTPHAEEPDGSGHCQGAEQALAYVHEAQGPADNAMG